MELISSKWVVIKMLQRSFGLTLVLLLLLSGCDGSAEKKGKADAIEILNVSYDPTRELFEEYNSIFIEKWHKQTGQTIKVNQSHGGSGKQSRSVIDGLKADVVTLALAFDIDAIAERSQLLPADWQSKLPNQSTPFTSTIVFIVREGNPKQIKDWGDLVRTGVEVVAPNPKTSGAARWAYLAAWGFADRTWKDPEKTKQFMSDLYGHVPVLDTGARGSTTTFAQRGIGDVLLTWENEAFLTVKEAGQDKVDIVYPSISILAEPPVAVVEKITAKRNTTAAARAYLEGLYGLEAQALVARHGYRPVSAEGVAQFAASFPKIELFTIADFGGWAKAQATHFADGGMFDQIYKGK